MSATEKLKGWFCFGRERMEKKDKKCLNGYFKLIAIRTITPTVVECEETIRSTIVQAMQKAMYENNDWRYFSNGCQVSDDEKEIFIPRDTLYEQHLFVSGQTNVTIGAIVGKNGSGKSTLVDLTIRMMNNVAAAIIGESPRFAAAEHLHFIDYLFGELIYLREGKLMRLEMRDRKIKLYKYNLDHTDEKGLWFREDCIHKTILDGKNEERTNVLPHSKKMSLLQDQLFYSVICNYSFYAYNYRDYVYEQTDDKRIDAITDGKGVERNEEKFWISGVFHKNDGYQTPLVLNPWRKDGNLDVAKENDLAMERIISLLFYYDAIRNRYPFRKILDKLIIKYIKLPERNRKPFVRKDMLTSLFGNDNKYAPLKKNLDDWLYDLIIEKWKEVYFIGGIGTSRIEEDAKDYAVYKTMKICSRYKGYVDIMEEMMKPNADKEKIKRRLDDLGSDRTHITSKLRRTCYQLRYKYYQYQSDFELGKSVAAIDEWMKGAIENHNDEEEGVSLSYDDLLPPPLLDFNLGIEDTKGRVVPFTGLSTGERQASYVISNLMYHLVNINSAWNDPADAHEVKYNYVNLMLDEVELYFHPELQRNFVDMLLSAIRSVGLPHIKGINITLVSHSPFVISDLPHTNIMYLGHRGENKGTFGANIYDLLNSSFFMDDSIGELAKSRIEQFANAYSLQMSEWKIADSKGEKREVNQNVVGFVKESGDVTEYICSLVGDDYMREQMLDMYQELEENYKRMGVLS